MDLASLNRATTLPGLNREDVYNLMVAVPPCDEQHRIAVKLDELIAIIRTARTALATVPSLLETYRQSLLAAAFRDDLDVLPAESHGLEAEAESGQSRLPRIPASWAWANAADVVEPDAEIVYGIVQPGPHVPDGVPYIRGKDIQEGAILEHQLLRTAPSIASRYKRASLKGGDVLLGIIRATKVAVVPASLDGANITQGTARFRPSNVIRTGFLAAWLASPYAQRWLHDQYRGIDMPGLNLRDVRRLPVPVPPLATQAIVESRLTEAVQRIRSVREAVRQGAERASALEASMLSTAFLGGLGPQDPADEPASLLIARISQSRSTADKQGRPRNAATLPKSPRDRKQNTMTKSRFDAEVRGQPYLAAILRQAEHELSVEELYRRSDLPLVDFYKQLGWEVANEYVRDDTSRLQAL